MFRNIYEAHFGRFDFLLAPFVSTIKGERVKDYHVRDTLPHNDDGTIRNDTARVIPQIIGKDANGFLLLARKFADIGFTCINWNLGCPAPQITKKQRGCGLLPHRDLIQKILDDISPTLPLQLSIKTRLGLHDNRDLEKLMPLFNDYPLKEIIIHPRTGVQLYDGIVDLDKFAECLYMSKHPVVYNGDIRTKTDFANLQQRFPTINKWMIGRGVIINPNLLPILRDDNAPPQQLRPFLDDLFNAALKQSDVKSALGRMKEIWRYLAINFRDGGATLEKILRARTVGEYQKIIDGVGSVNC